MDKGKMIQEINKLEDKMMESAIVMAIMYGYNRAKMEVPLEKATAQFLKKWRAGKK